MDPDRNRPNLSNAWWERCWSERRPYVVVRPNRKREKQGKRAFITVDLLPMEACFTDEGCKRIRAARSKHIAEGRSAFIPGQVRIDMYGIPADVAEELAAEVYDVACTEHVLGVERWDLLEDHVLRTPHAIDLEEPTDSEKPIDLEESKETERKRTEIYRILRDTALARRVKALHENRCQICGTTLPLPDGSSYGEAHHIKPLGNPHHGPDVESNILVLCPNHHGLSDLGAIRIHLDKLRTHPAHKISKEFIDYHNEKIARS